MTRRFATPLDKALSNALSVGDSDALCTSIGLVRKNPELIEKASVKLLENSRVPSIKKQLGKLAKAMKIVAADGSAFSLRLFRDRAALAAENVFLRRQLPLFQEHEQKAQRTIADDRFTLSNMARFFDWREALVIVKAATLIGWHRNAFRRLWRWKSRPVGRPPLSDSLREVIRQMAAENPSWGEERIADELLLKLGLRVSPRTVAKYVNQQPGPRGRISAGPLSCGTRRKRL